jgi:prepilin-type N-terminal cleavage/methylation domain-containing protein
METRIPTMTSRIGKRSDSGFTLLELLLVLVVLSLLAAMAFPRFSGALSQLSWEKQKDGILDFLYHCERLARIKGEALVLSWDEEQHSFLLYHAWASSPLQRALPPALSDAERSIDTGSFLEFARQVTESVEGIALDAGPQDRTSSGAARPPGFEWMQGLVERLPLDSSYTVGTMDFPLVFRTNGEATKGELLLERGAHDRARLQVEGLIGETTWQDL